MQASSSRVTTIEQLYATAGGMTAPVLLHVDGKVEWGNRSFLQRFGVNDDVLSGAKVRDLLWCLGLNESVAGMISEGAIFHHCEIPPQNPNDSRLFLKQARLTMQPDGRKRMMLVLADEFDPPTEDLLIGDN
jgi:hypothetical protein